MENTEKWINQGIEFITDYGPKVLGALLIFIIGSWVIGKIIRTLKVVMSKSNYDETLQSFLANLASWGLKIMLILVVIYSMTTGHFGEGLAFLFTPGAIDGRVEAIAVEGDRVYVGGTFTQIQEPLDGEIINQPYLFAYSKSTSTSFVISTRY